VDALAMLDGGTVVLLMLPLMTLAEDRLAVSIDRRSSALRFSKSVTFHIIYTITQCPNYSSNNNNKCQQLQQTTTTKN